ncbi:HAD-IIA family hydrolase [Opitutus sp. ER46]|uniref:HAD-IIA family hydrolase n=1 Tax=Opitutus sp. ER46 TaxID=2161864 RepID=UPI000D302949|nr:HAD-IIA family hydrolase [Opitutus sp. ER46]PTX91552.1 hydrolase [Opitutus sp. ER46]
MPASSPASSFSPALARSLRGLRHVALDMDGTIYKGGTLFACTLPFLERMKSLGIGCSFLTNNPSKSAADYLAHLRKIGVPAAPDQLYTSALATIDFLRSRRPELRRLFVLGTPSMQAEFAAAGFTLTADDPKDEPDAVVVGFDLTLTYARLCRSAWWIHRGKPYFATNPDLVCPTDLPNVLVDCGSICAALAQAAGRTPDQTFGKPDPSMLDGIRDRHGLRSEQIAMVGDRIYTDMMMAHRAKALGVLVLSGEATAADAAAANPPPDLVVPTLAELGEAIATARSNPTSL